MDQFVNKFWNDLNEEIWEGRQRNLKKYLRVNFHYRKSQNAPQKGVNVTRTRDDLCAALTVKRIPHDVILSGRSAVGTKSVSSIVARVKVVFCDLFLRNFSNKTCNFVTDACLASRTYALAHRKTSKFVPKCRSDGNYALVQCLPSGGCWCVDPQGKPIPKTRVENGYGRPTCAQKSKSNQRRSSPRKLGVQTKKSECLVRVFVSHYISKHTHTHYLFIWN